MRHYEFIPFEHPDLRWARSRLQWMRMQILRGGLVILGLFAGLSASAWAGASAFPEIESVKGAATALLQNGLELREVKKGDEIHYGDHIRTDAKTEVSIIYPDGSKLKVLPGTDVAVREPNGGVQDNELQSGRVMGDIQKAPGEEGSSSKKKIKFIIRTKSATMGVRGTQFVAAADAVSGLAQFHTLEGSVEVASDPGALLSGHGVPVSGGKFITATASGLSEVKPFVKPDLMKSLSAPFGSSGSTSSGAFSSGKAVTQDPAAVTQTAPPPPRIPETPKMAEQRAALEEKKTVEAEEERARFHPIAFNFGAFVSGNPNPDAEFSSSDYFRAIWIAWSPYLPLPIPLLRPYVRGSLGLLAAQDGSLNSNFLIHEFTAYAGTEILSPLFAEIGGGEQIWLSRHIDSGILGINAGIILNKNGRFNRLFVGVSRFFGGARADQARAGITIQF